MKHFCEIFLLNVNEIGFVFGISIGEAYPLSLESVK